MASETEICNLSLSHLAISRDIGNVDTENSAEAKACRRFFDIARDATLRDFAWPFATESGELGLVEEDPTTEWSYSYRYPSTCLQMRRIFSGSRNDSQETRVPFVLASDSTGRLIYTDQEEAEAEWTKAVTDAGQFSADFVMALSWRLAAYIAPRLTAGDRSGLGEKALRMYYIELNNARANAVQEECQDQPPESEFIRARE